jgi:hypothetical protein
VVQCKSIMTKYNVPCFCHPAGHRAQLGVFFFFVNWLLSKKHYDCIQKLLLNLRSQIDLGSWVGISLNLSSDFPKESFVTINLISAIRPIKEQRLMRGTYKLRVIRVAVSLEKRLPFPWPETRSPFSTRQ